MRHLVEVMVVVEGRKEGGWAMLIVQGRLEAGQALPSMSWEGGGGDDGLVKKVVEEGSRDVSRRIVSFI